MNNIAIIPARGGSKRLPRKNCLPFLGKPMFLWTYEAARDSKKFSEIVLSTEDAEITQIAKANGINVLQRPRELATDEATCNDVCLHALEYYAQRGKSFDALCCLYATSPLRTAQDINCTMSLLEDDDAADFAFAVCLYGHSPYQSLVADAKGWLTPSMPLLVQMKSQYLPTPLIGNGSTYAARVNAFVENQGFYGKKLKGYVMPAMRSVDIDTQEDFDIALCFAKYVLGKE